jgi:collagen type I/II/III/V/XI/XXIV/XXVII alpha
LEERAMTTVTWTSGTSGDWNAAADWSPQQVPQSGDTAIITAGSADLLSGIDPAAAMTLLLGGPTVSGSSGAAPNAFLYTLNTAFGPNFTLADTTPGTEGVLATSGITTFSGQISVSGANTALALGVDRPNPVGVKARYVGPVTNSVPNPGDQGDFQDSGAISVTNGGLLVVTPLNTLDGGLVSMEFGTINLDAGTLVSTYVSLGPPQGGIGASGTVNLANGSNLAVQMSGNIDVNFQDGSNDKLAFTSTDQAATISGFRHGDEIAQAPQSLLGSSTPYQNQGLTYNPVTHVLEITTGVGGTPYLDYVLAGTYTQSEFSAADDANGNLIITTTACFAEGTRIATAGGESAVERLVPGMRVQLADGGIAPVAWIGHRRIDCERHPRPDAVWPVEIAPHAFGLGRPARTLRLSPDHAVFVDGVLIPVRYLLNGATVAQRKVAHVTYYHVELPAHAVLLAEGMPAESYLDTGNRAAFANGGTTMHMHADFARGVWATRSCARLVTAGPVRDRVYRQLLVQACALGWRMHPAEAPGEIRWRRSA